MCVCLCVCDSCYNFSRNLFCIFIIFLLYSIVQKCFLVNKNNNFAEDRLRETFRKKLELHLPWYSFGGGKKNIFSFGLTRCRDSQARRLVVDSLQRNPRATWTSTRPIKMYTALYIERDRSHDTLWASPMGIFYRGELVYVYERERVHKLTYIYHTSVCVSRGWF